MKKYMLFASALQNMEEIEALHDSDSLDLFSFKVAPVVEVTANNLYEAIEIYSKQFNNPANRHPVFQAQTRYFYIKIGDKFENVKRDNIDAKYQK